jgi:hypothetical protein
LIWQRVVDDGAVSAGSRPSCEELAALVVAQADRIAQLEVEVAELRRQVGQNSQDSSRPVCHEREGGVRM